MPKRAPPTRQRVREFRSRASLVRYLDGPGFRWNWYREFDPPLSDREGFKPDGVATFIAYAPPVPVIAPAFSRELIRRFRWTVRNPGLWHGPDGATSLPPLGFHPIHWGRSANVVVYLGHTAHLSGEAWQVEELPASVGLVEPYVDEHSLTLASASGRILTPQQWIDLGAASGLRMRWVGPDEEPVATFRVPADYDGCSLALEGPARRTGLISISAAPDDGWMFLHGIDIAGDRAVQRLIAAYCRLPDALVSTGNCTFTGREWLRYRRTKVVPRPKPERAVAATVLPLRRP